MKLIEWTDDDGYKRAAVLRDHDPDLTRDAGVPVGPPDLDRLDWEGIKRDLHNQLFTRKLFSWDDVQKAQQGITASVQAALQKRVVMLYRDSGG